jgi:hypothetical protein
MIPAGSLLSASVLHAGNSRSRPNSLGLSGVICFHGSSHPAVPPHKIPLWFQHRIDRPDVFERAKYKERSKCQSGWSRQFDPEMVSMLRARPSLQTRTLNNHAPHSVSSAMTNAARLKAARVAPQSGLYLSGFRAITLSPHGYRTNRAAGTAWRDSSNVWSPSGETPSLESCRPY